MATPGSWGKSRTYEKQQQLMTSTLAPWPNRSSTVVVYPKEAALLRGLSPTWKRICTMGKICPVGAIQWCFNWQNPKTLSKTSKLQDESCFNSLRKPLFNRLLLVLGKSKCKHNSVYSLVEKKCPHTWRDICHKYYTQVNMNAVYAAERLANRGIHLFVRLLPSKSSNSPVCTM